MVLPEELQNQLNFCLERMIAFEEAQKGTLQFYDALKNILVIVAHKGFRENFLKHFKEVKPFDSSTSGRAVGIGAPVIMGDINSDFGFLPHRAVALEAGYRSVKSVPIYSDEKKLLGALSLYCTEPRWNWKSLPPEMMHEMRTLLAGIHPASNA